MWMPGLTASRRRASTFFYLQDETRTNTVGDNPSSESHGMGTERKQGGEVHQQLRSLCHRGCVHPLCRLPRRHADEGETAAALLYEAVPLVLPQTHVGRATGTIQYTMWPLPQKDERTDEPPPLGNCERTDERAF